ncbi:methyltransferase domain-containing protein [Haloarcula laminariae]|uniref:methyltransferase domain-containing protein n=1 Tax=Haloarcula laminariae TaxID=2961577 RepID=UPI0021CAA479|nr:methyltransferase domain-containing protein [Halomicroarcula laminariae]
MDAFRQWAFDRRDHAHSQRVYDWWSRHDRVYAGFVTAFLLGRTGEFRDRTVAALSLERGDTVLDVGCGPGPNFERLAGAVGPTGTIVGVDASPGMVKRARERGEELDCETEVLRADAGRLPVANERFDGVCATLSLSAMGDVGTVVEEISDVLRPGGRIAVLDAQSFQTAPLRWLNPLIEGVSAYMTNWYPDAPIIKSVEETFTSISIETFHGETVYVVTAVEGR